MVLVVATALSSAIAMKYYRFFTVIVVALLWSGIGYCQPTLIEQFQFSGNSGGSYVLQAPDGGTVIYGSTPAGSTLMKRGADGQMQWARSSGLVLCGIALDSEGNIYGAGTDGMGMAIVKCSPSGLMAWNRIYRINWFMDIQSLRLLSDNSILVCGSMTDSLTHSYCDLLVCFRQTGEIAWTSALKPSGVNTGGTLTCAIELPDRSIVAVGYTPINDGAPFQWLQLIHTSADGQVLDKYFYLDSSQSMRPSALLRCSDGSIIVAGQTADKNNRFESSSLLLKLDSSFVPQWCTATFFLTFDHIDQVIEADSGALIAVASSGHIARYSKAGKLEWTKGYGDSTVYLSCTSLLPQPSGGFMAVGSLVYPEDTKAVNLCLLRLDSMARSCIMSEALVSNRQISMLRFEATDLTPAPVYPVAYSPAISTKPAELPTIVTVCSSEAEVKEISTPQATAAIYPNPAEHASSIVVHLSGTYNGEYLVRLRDLAGSQVYRNIASVTSTNEIRIPTTGLTSGIYFVELADANSFATLWRGKVVIE